VLVPFSAAKAALQVVATMEMPLTAGDRCTIYSKNGVIYSSNWRCY